MQRISIFFILLFSFLSIALSGQTIWYVSPTGSGNQNGSSWANAARLQVAINNAPTNAELRLRRGVYNITSTLVVQRTIRMYGGYTGSGDTRNPASTPSVLDGGGRVPIMETRYSTENSIFDGLTIQNGYARVGTHINDISVPGIFLQGSNSRIINCIFRNNISQNRIGSGAILLFNSDNVVIDNCRFEENRINVIPYNFGAANEGAGAIQIRFVRGTRILNSTFRNNYSTYYGGAITHHGENTLIDNCDFQGNTSLLNGGAIYSQYENLRVVNSRFNENRSSSQGGAIATTFSQIEIVRSIFRNNTASDVGGAIYNHRFAEPSVIEKSQFYDNQSSQGGAVYNFSEEGLKIANTLFHRNTATDKGGAIFNYRVIQIANSTFVGNTNTAVIIPRYANTPSNPNITHIYNSIFYQNTAKTGGFRPDIHSEIVNADSGEKDIRRNITQSYTAGTANLVGVNPLFINNSTNFRLQQTSPAVNYGVNTLYNQVSATPAGTSTDLANLPRLVGASIDLGAYEVQPVVLACPAMTLPTPDATNVPITTNISWNTITNATGYRISIGTTPGGTNIRNNFDVGNLTTYNHPTNFSPETRYYVRITPYNTVSATANCSEYSFTTANPTISIPPCSTITFPANNATNVSINPTISWTASSGATGYRIRVGTTAGGNDVFSQNLGNVTSFTLPSNLNYGTNYFVQIIPFNSAGDATGCSEHRFRTENAPISIPPCSTITFPTNSATNVSINPTISWTASSGATGYRIQVGTTAGGNDVFSQNLGNVTSFTPPSNLNYNTNYFVRIIPFNSAGDATGCSEHRFRTENAPISIPPCSTITFPANNATNVSIDPTISWIASSGATGYRIRVGTTAGGSDVFSQNLGNVTSFTLPSNLNYSTNYFVRIIPFNSAGDATGCSEHRFRTENAPISIPPCSTITFPANNATNVSINPTISWTASSGATGYRIQVGTTAGGSDFFSQNLGNVTSFTLPSNSNYNTTYFVQIIPFNSAGDATGCSEHLFTTENQVIKEFKIPNTFTPNGDGINDTIDFSELLNQNDLKIRVFDRYGKVHFEGNQSNQFIWDGTFYGKKSGTGTYWYLIEWTDALGEKHLEKGWILLKSR